MTDGSTLQQWEASEQLGTIKYQDAGYGKDEGKRKT